MTNGTFFDGKSAKKHAVHASLAGTVLTVRNSWGETLAEWPLPDISAVYDDTNRQLFRLTVVSNPDAALTLDDHKLFPRIEPYIANTPRNRSDYGFTWLQAISVVTATVAIACLLYLTLPILLHPLLNVFPAKWELSLGTSVVASIPGANNACRNESGRQSLTKLTRSLSQVMDLPYPVTVTVARMNIKNAFAAPGGFIVIGKDLVEEMASPDEFAGVLAHEMAHIAERHPISRIIHILGISVIFDMIVGSDATVAETLLQGAGLLLFLSHSRDDEREADRIALESLIKAGFSTKGLSTLFARLRPKYEDHRGMKVDTLSSWLNTHPSFAERIDNASAKIKNTGKAALSSPEWAALKTICVSKSRASAEIGPQFAPYTSG
ncbi:MAG: Beta-barrel assembly-enhancing protease [Alphaproteobacteria bacterium MarineAlpha4_Bin2]|nr:MAG: Beta-barrel assembly-enhancing protease [Alphaproteobacteria bacterium MarineAlpha4_Bin2]|tara:strand:- start:18 stop:1157 length:1140 start_codon:yes stop_codon:yes gene_type:complete